MTKNLNEDLYNRFGLSVDKKQVINGFRTFLANEAWKVTYPMCHPELYKDPHPRLLIDARIIVLEELCRELFLDNSDYYSWSEYSAGELLKEIFENHTDSFEILLVKTQVFINVIYKQKAIHEELDLFVNKVRLYTSDFPILGIIVKDYKTRAPQILPATSPRLDKEIFDTLGVLDTDKYKTVLNEFEMGLRLFSKAKTDSQFKDVVEDMYASCDEIVKLVLNDKHKGFKHAFDKTTYKNLGLNGHQKEIFKHLKSWMDEIKHGSRKNIERWEIEMIISMSASFVRHVAIFFK